MFAYVVAMNVKPEGSTGRLSQPLLAGRASAASVAELAGPWLGTAVLPFVLVFYLAMQGGGYDPIVRGEVGIAAWWILVLGVAVGELPRRRPAVAASGALALLALFAVWVGLGISGAESSERAIAELARVLSLLGVFALAIAAQGPGGLRRTIGAVATAVALVGGLALLSRLEPGWFPSNVTAQFLPETGSRLGYPINYWNGLATLVVIGVPLLLTVSLSAARIPVRALAAAAIPPLVLTGFFTLSRGGALELAAALSVLAVLWPRRLAALPVVAVTALGSILLVIGGLQRDALQDALQNEAAISQGDSMLAMVLVVCVGVGLLVTALSYAERFALLPSLRPSRRQAGALAGAAAVIVVVVGLAAGAPGELSDRWQEFKTPIEEGSTAERFTSASGNGRYEYWQASVDAFESEPLTGIGPGSYEFWWAREGSVPGFVRDAHSLYLETLAEMGIVGLALLVGLLGWVLAAGVVRMREANVQQRMLLAGALAAMVAFLVAAAIDWVWEITVLPVAFLLLAAALVGDRGGPRSSARLVARAEQAPKAAPRSRARGVLIRGALVLAALVALALVAIPLASDKALRASQAAAASGQFGPALDDASEADRLEPYAATPNLQKALLLETQGDLVGALAAVTEATMDEPTNWRTWLTRSRIEAESGEAEASVRSYRRARSLNPRSPLFQGG